jgi:hypothetical protein
MASVDSLVTNVAAAGDGRGAAEGSPLTRYYAAEGYPPGTWLGSGLPGVGGADQLDREVTEDQLRVLFEDAREPVHRRRLGEGAGEVPDPESTDRAAHRVASGIVADRGPSPTD